MTEEPIYPVGQHDFKTIIEDGFIYVDKTQYIAKLLKQRCDFCFLARPRRFGKSLFLSTLRYFFEGKRELFKGLAIDSYDNWDWAEYPVLYLNLNTERYGEADKLDYLLDKVFTGWEKKYGVEKIYANPPQRFEAIIEAAHEKTGKKVVILVDEYDKPLVTNINKDENFEQYRTNLAALYSNFKSSVEHIRMVFLTGVSRFGKLSIFSDNNNIDDISFDERYADICGITEQELYANFGVGIQELADKMKINYDEACKALKESYDGYRFEASGSDIYNPWSILNCFRKNKIENYWSDTGYPTIIAEALKREHSDLKEILNTRCLHKELRGMDLRSLNPVALMYQGGYLTIKEYDDESKEYLLGLPNAEVKEQFFEVILPYYMNIRADQIGSLQTRIINSVQNGKPEDLMLNLQTYFSKIGYPMRMENENNFHNVLYALTVILGMNSHSEYTTSNGRIDILVETQKYIYILELKYDHTAEDALRQIEERHYARPWQTDGRTIFKIGVSFSSKTRTIESWKIDTQLPR